MHIEGCGERTEVNQNEYHHGEGDNTTNKIWRISHTDQMHESPYRKIKLPSQMETLYLRIKNGKFGEWNQTPNRPSFDNPRPPMKSRIGGQPQGIGLNRREL